MGVDERVRTEPLERCAAVIDRFKKGDKTDPGNYRDVISYVVENGGKMCLQLSNGGVLEKESKKSVDQVGFTKKQLA